MCIVVHQLENINSVSERKMNIYNRKRKNEVAVQLLFMLVESLPEHLVLRCRDSGLYGNF